RGHRMTVSPRFFGLLGVVALLLLSAVIAPRVRRRSGSESIDLTGEPRSGWSRDEAEQKENRA
ncbi:MAG TPA: hypothetical protein VHS13_08125, partial [Edaphobacter sp.]|nr:hypothetical protein [Edaphobacter sp.]